MTANEDLSEFIRSSFPSVWTLELLLLLKREPHSWTQEDLVQSLRASDLVVSQALASLVAGGLASVSDEGAVYLPVSDAVAKLVDRTEELYVVKPDKVRRMIVGSSSPGITAFSDAFKLRKD